jgi:hypothetical protein
MIHAGPNRKGWSDWPLIFLAERSGLPLLERHCRHAEMRAVGPNRDPAQLAMPTIIIRAILSISWMRLSGSTGKKNKPLKRAYAQNAYSKTLYTDARPILRFHFCHHAQHRQYHFPHRPIGRDGGLENTQVCALLVEFMNEIKDIAR